MDLGYFTMPLHPPGANFTKTIKDDLDQIVTLDQLGYKEAWIGEHFTSEWENIPAPDLLIAQALALTKNIILGTGVNAMPNHHPFVLAHRIAQLDHMANGRFYWGIGSGGFPGDFEVFGFDPKSGEQRGMTRDAVDLIIQMWEDPKPGQYKHKYWDFNIPIPDEEIGLSLHLKPYQKPHPPIGVAGISPNSETLTVAGERGWMPMSINLIPTRIIKSHWDTVASGAKNAGKTADRSLWRICREIYVADSSEQARTDVLNGVLRRDFENYFFKSIPLARMTDLLKTDINMPDSDITIEYMMNDIFIVGSPEDVATKIRNLYETVGGFGVLVAMGHEWEPRDKWLHSMELLKNEVMPKLSDLNP